MYTLKEHQAKKLIDTSLTESIGIKGRIKPETVQKLNESSEGKKKRKLIVQMEAIHVGRTANYTFYTEEGLKAGLDSWTHPYPKPVLTHHNAYDGEPIGRILRAEFSENTISGRKGLIFTCEISDPEAIEKVLDGRYSTVSIGATTDKVTCNICGTDRTKEWCDHWKGEEYDGQTCHFIIGTTFGREVSYVNVPADENAGNVAFQFVDDEKDSKGTKESVSMQIFQIAEGLMQSADMPEVNLYESVSEDVKKLVDGLLDLNEGSAPRMKYTLNEQNQLVDESGKAFDIEELMKAKEKLDEAQQEINNLSKELQEAKDALSKTVIEKSKVDAQLSESQEEVDRLTTENAELVQKAHQALAEKVVDMKLMLRKSDVIGVTKEDAIAEHIKRSEESLLDTVKDLEVELKNSTVVRGSVPNPGAAGGDNNPNKQNENQNETMTVKEAVDMFKGMLSKKR